MDDIVHVLPFVSMIAVPLPAATIEPSGDGIDVEVLLKVISCSYEPFLRFFHRCVIVKIEFMQILM